jgi:hypothetical protein
MQATQNNLVDLLREKDEEFETPEGWAYVKKNKSQFLLELEEKSRFEHVAAGNCIKPCFKAMKTSVVSVEESECMTNCMAKAMESRALFDFLKAKKDYK